MCWHVIEPHAGIALAAHLRRRVWWSPQPEFAPTLPGTAESVQFPESCGSNSNREQTAPTYKVPGIDAVAAKTGKATNTKSAPVCFRGLSRLETLIDVAVKA